MAERVHAVITGLVQGVGFRYFVQSRAGAFGIGGWVQNRPDGSVELVAEGDPQQLDAFLSAVRAGPRAAQVTDLRVERTEVPTVSTTFEVR